MVLDARAFRALPPLDANGTTAYIQDSSARSGQDRRGGTVAGAFPDTPELLPGKLVTGPAKLGTAGLPGAPGGAGRGGRARLGDLQRPPAAGRGAVVTQRGEGGDPAPASDEDGVMRAHPEGTVVRLRVVAGARRTELVGLRARDLQITAGERARDKLVLVRGRSPGQVRASLLDPGQ